MAGICYHNKKPRASKPTPAPVVKTGVIYGVKRTYGSASTAWERTDDSANYTATASVGSTAGSSDFDNAYIYKDMKRVTIVNMQTGYHDVWVTVPKFYYQRKVENGIESIRITPDADVDGFELHPAFLADGVEYNEVLISAYEGQGNACSVAGMHPSHNTRTVFRNIATAERNNANCYKYGGSYGMIDIACWSMLQMLYLVEFADYNANAKIGISVERKTSSASVDGKINTGQGDTIATHTGRATTNTTAPRYNAIRYRWIENPFGNSYCWIDGVNTINGVTWICTDPSKYNDGTTGYTKLGYSLPTVAARNGYLIKTIGYDPNMPWVMLPNEYATITFDANNTTNAYTQYCSDRCYYVSTAGLAHCVGGSCLEQGFGANGWFNLGTAAPSLIRLDICSRMVLRR